MEHSFKLVLLGEGRVGKTSLVLRYIENTFSEKTRSTVQASFLTKRLAIGDDHIALAIWDTAGQERFHALGPIYYRDANGAVLVYDVTDPGSLDRVKNWVKELRTMLGNDVVLVIAGNKIDLERNRMVDQKEAESYAESINAHHVLVSAKTGKGVEEAFLQVTRGMLKRAGGSAGAGAARRGGRRRVVVEDDSGGSAQQGGGGGCC